jgi:uncharacterized protein (TIGR01777 family)
MNVFEKSSSVPVSAKELFDYHDRPGALERLLPPWRDIEVLEKSGGIRDGGRVKARMRIGPFASTGTALHHDFIEGKQFVDEQENGPFAAWKHTHRFVAETNDNSILSDRIEYQLPGGAVGNTVFGNFARKELERMFRFRHARTRNDLIRQSAYKDRAKLRILISGGTGLVGSALAPFLTVAGHRVERLVRGRPRNPEEISWNVESGEIDTERASGADALIHLAGRNIAVRWNKRTREEIWNSRVPATQKLCEKLALLKNPPKTLIVASGIGYYGDRGDELLTEQSSSGSGFTAEICKGWEAATVAAEKAGIRVVRLRIGMVLAARGGALKKLLLPTRLGLSGPIGSGRQYVSWIALDDLIGVIWHLLMSPSANGVYNAVAPEPVRQRDFIKTFARVLHRPAILPMPVSGVRLLFGQMGEEVLLSSMRVAPAALMKAKFPFLYPELEAAIRFECGLS